jgi:hypothetical protein
MERDTPANERIASSNIYVITSGIDRGFAEDNVA